MKRKTNSHTFIPFKRKPAFTTHQIKESYLTENSGGTIQPPCLFKKHAATFNKTKEETKESGKECFPLFTASELPIQSCRKSLVKILDEHDNVIIIGETGSGKTTQVPKFIFENGMHRKKMIAVTQPRRVAAMTVSERVAQEMNATLGELVGYSVRFDDTSSDKTKLKFLTDGMLLREAMLDPLLKRYSWIILDEAHERTIQTDILFGVVKRAQCRRKLKGKKTLKIVVMSATIDSEVDRFAEFLNAEVVRVKGRQHEIVAHHVKQSHSDYVSCCVATAWQLHTSALVDEHFVIFLTGQEEIEYCVQLLNDLNEQRDVSVVSELLPLPMYAALPLAQQAKIFRPAKKGCRKIIVATNIAETSVTIPGVRYVIDSGRVKTRTYNSFSGLDILAVRYVSQAQVFQRAGRAGREASGKCFWAFTEQEFEKFDKTTEPEILRTNLASVVLQLCTLGIKDVTSFDFLDRPTDAAMQNAIDQLTNLGALVTDTSDETRLTDIGRRMAVFPLDPRLSRCILAASKLGCLRETVAVASLLSVDSIMITPEDKKEQAASSRVKFIAAEGDLVTYLNIYRAFKSFEKNKKWASENFLNTRNLSTAKDINRQLCGMCENAGLSLKSCGRDFKTLRKSFCAGYFDQVAELQPDGSYVTIDGREIVSIHPSSVLFQYKPAYVVYAQLVKTTKSYMRDLCVVDPEWLMDAAPKYYKNKRLKLD